MYSQWKSAQHYQNYQATLSNADAPPYVKQVFAIAKFDPGMYEVIKVFARPLKPAR